MELSFILLSSIIFLLSSLSFALQLLRYYRRPKPNNSTIVKGYPVVGNLPYFIKHYHRILDWVAELIPTSPTATVTVAPFVFTANPANVEHLAKSRFPNYPKCDAYLSIFHDLFGHGILNATGDEWRLQRRAASYEFNAKSLRAFVHDNVRVELQGRLLPLLKKASRSGEVLDLQNILERFAFDNICKSVLNHDPQCLIGDSEEGERFFHAMEEATRFSIDRAKEPISLTWKLKKWLGVASERKLRESLATVHERVEKLIVQNRREPSGSSRFLSGLLEDDTISDELLRDILICFMVAGRDTTPSALTWFFWVVGTRPDVIEKIRSEISSERQQRGGGGGGEGQIFEEATGTAYLHAAITESMRLYPPVPMLARECQEAEELPDGTTVEKGWTVWYSAHAMGRAKELWGPDFNEYRPERWLEDGEFRPVSPFKYPVFHAGPRICLGKEMAYVQMKAVAAAVLEKFDLQVAEERGEYDYP